MNRAFGIILAGGLLVPSVGLAQSAGTSAQVNRGEYLVTQDIVVKAPASVTEPWMGAMSPTLTAWSGPWGVSFSANLTPDPETGVLRDFTEAQFIQTMRTGRHRGQGREILPPMPWPFIGKMTDDDLKAVFAYLRQVPAVKNKVPDPIPPAK